MNEKVLVAREGYIYTNGKDYGKIIGLGIYDHAYNWYEITEEQYYQHLEEEMRNKQNETQ